MYEFGCFEEKNEDDTGRSGRAYKRVQAVSHIDEYGLVELSGSHDIHRFHPRVFIEAVNKLR